MDNNEKIVKFPIVDLCIDYHEFSSKAKFISQIINEKVDYEELGYSEPHFGYVGLYFLKSQGLPDNDTLNKYMIEYDIDKE